MKETIWINRDIGTVWNFVELEFAKSFKCSPKKLINKKNVIKRGKKEITQSIIIQDKPHHLAILSEDKTDHVETHYEFLEDDEGSFLSLREFGKGKNSVFKTLYYKAQTLPIIRSKRKRQQRQRLESIKYLLENESE